jgi:hypothetical protein
MPWFIGIHRGKTLGATGNSGPGFANVSRMLDGTPYVSRQAAHEAAQTCYREPYVLLEAPDRKRAMQLLREMTKE